MHIKEERIEKTHRKDERDLDCIICTIGQDRQYKDTTKTLRFKERRCDDFANIDLPVKAEGIP